jgi:protein-disulfide isomerase
MKSNTLKLSLLALAALVALGAVIAVAQVRANSDAGLKARVHAFLDRTLGWQGLTSMEVESISAPDASGLRRVKVMLTKGDQHQEATYLITADGKEIIEGTASPLSADPWAKTRAELDLRGAPAAGPANAPVTIVEFSDLECPYCKQESEQLAQLMQADPGQVRLVFKFYPLVKIHPWSMQAALAGACVAEQGSTQFWNFEKAVFDAQDQITPANVTQRLSDFATEAGANAAGYQSCIGSAAAKRTVEASIANGDKVGVVSTPTLFINGRMVPGALQESELKLLVDHEATFAAGGSVSTGATAGALNQGEPKGQQCGGCTPLPPLPPKSK